MKFIIKANALYELVFDFLIRFGVLFKLADDYYYTNSDKVIRNENKEVKETNKLPILRQIIKAER